MCIRYDAFMTILASEVIFLFWTVPVGKMISSIIYLLVVFLILAIAGSTRFVNLCAEPVWQLGVYNHCMGTQRDFSHAFQNAHLKLAGGKHGSVTV